MTIFKKILASKSGNFGIMAALLAIPLVGGVGVALDFVSAYNRQMDIQNAADAAVLAAAASRSSDEKTLKEVAEKTFKANLAGLEYIKSKIGEISVHDGKYVTIKVESLVPVTLAGIFKPEGIRIEAISQAVIGSDDKVEVAMVLDNTYSMVGQKLTDLKAASNTLLDVFEKSLPPKDKGKAKFALVPFSTYVNVGMTNRSAKWISVAADTSSSKEVCSTTKPIISKSECTTTKYTAYNDGVPYTATSTTCKKIVYGDPVTKCSMQTSTTKWSGCVGSRNNPFDVTDENATGKKYTGMMNTSCGAAVTQLSADFTALRAQIKAMVANNETYIPAGVLWGVNMLSPEEPFTDASAYSDDVKKFMIVMTDGDNTRSPGYPNHNNKDKKKADTLMTDTCTNAKKKGITIFTVAVGITDTTTLANLSSCATDTGKAISVKDTTTLQAVFGDIAKQILAVRLTR